MKSLVTTAVVGLLALVAAPLSAQGTLWIGGGGTFPTSDYGEYANTGYIAMVGGGASVGDAMMVGVNVFYGQNNHEAVAGDKTNPHGIMGLVEYDFSGRDADASVYVLAEAGLMRHKYSSDISADATESGFGYAAALGYGFPLGGVNGWVEGRFMQASISDSNTQFFGIVAGISIALGD